MSTITDHHAARRCCGARRCRPRPPRPWARAGRADAARHAHAAHRRRRLRRAAHAQGDAGGRRARSTRPAACSAARSSSWSRTTRPTPKPAVRAARKLIDVDKVPVDHGHLGLGGDHRGGAGVLGEQDVPDHGLRRGLDHPAAASGLPDPHAAEHYLQAAQARRVHHLEQGTKRVFVLSVQAPFAVPTQNGSTEVLTQKGVKVVGDADLRQGQDQLSLRDRPGAAGQAGPAVPQRLRARRGGAAARPLPGGLRGAAAQRSPMR